MNNEATTSWINKNRALLTNYKYQYVAITDRIIASGKKLKDVTTEAKKQSEDYVIYFVPDNVNKVKIYPIRMGLRKYIP